MVRKNNLRFEIEAMANTHVLDGSRKKCDGFF